jgi:ABC transport system ATP-binding/permease protein
MFKLVIQDDEGKTTIVPLIRDEITIGRKEGNTIRLTERNVSRRHARILRNNGEVHIEDLGSYNGIRVNNARIAERVSLRVSDQVQIGDYKLYLKAEGEQADEARTTPIERVEQLHAPAQSVSEAHTAPVANGTAPMAIHQAPTAPQIVGTPGRTLVAISDADPTLRAVGPATAAAVAALNATAAYGKLVVLSSNFAGKEFELSRPQMIIGRTDENDIVVNHRSISRNHAKLTREPETGRYTISDLQSSNGVRVNGQDYGKVELRRGDVVDLGHVRLRFVEAGEDFVFARDAVITDVPELGGRRSTIVALLAMIVVVVGGIVFYALRTSGGGGGTPGPGGDKPNVVTPGSGTSSGLAPDAVGEAVAVNHDVGSAAANPEVAAPVDASARTTSEATDRVIQECERLVVEHKWADVWGTGCHDPLANLDPEKAKFYLDKAKAEHENERHYDALAPAMKAGDWKMAQAELKSISSDSVYLRVATADFKKNETLVVDSIKKKVAAVAGSPQCAIQLHQIGNTVKNGTQAMADVVAAAQRPCLERLAQEAKAQIKSPGVGSGSAPVPPPTTSRCEQLDVDELIKQARDNYEAGAAAVALQQIEKVLLCRQSVFLTRTAALYACGARNADRARFYYAKIPGENQAAIQQRCQQESIQLP